MRVAVLDDYQDAALTAADWRPIEARADLVVFHTHLADERELAERLADFDVIVAMRERTPFPRSLVERLPNLKLLITTGARNAAFDMAALADAGVTVCGTGSKGSATSELTWGLILALMRGIPMEHSAVATGRWQIGLGHDLGEKTLGLIGLGRLGAKVAAVGQAFGMPVLAWSQNLTRERTDEVGVELASSLDDLLERADIASIHLVLSERTRGLIGRQELAKLGGRSYLVNTSRGPIVDEAALVTTLRNGVIAGAALDTFDVEPLPHDHPLLGLENVVLTPHIGYVTAETYGVFYADAIESILGFLDGTPVRVIE
ncbi:MAG: D-2-hydroxyacid dehydrogenase family protein [Chloroflexi bacterium]|nr:D-2-hydroxyacid dehydrogenase family protein [Chloroflexota bacterium]MDA1146258.1 D-2-hydroxyacid dehydrogenase family protein [Chloroflexota bacterium]